MKKTKDIYQYLFLGLVAMAIVGFAGAGNSSSQKRHNAYTGKEYLRFR